MRRQMMAATLAGLALSAAAGPHPRWVKQLAESKRPRWTAWRNSLAPKGKAVSLPLAKDGRTEYVIVIPANAKPTDSRAADELQLWLMEISGAHFPIVRDAEAPRERELSVGMTNRVGPDERDRLEEAGDRSYAICVRNERVFFLSAAPMGSHLPVFAFLEEDLGVRWYDTTVREPSGSWKKWWDKSKVVFRAERWAAEHSRVPKRPDLTGPVVPRISTPAFPLREVNTNRAMFPVPWTVRNRLNSGWATQYGMTGYAHGGFGVHTFHYLVPPKQHFEKNPEYYALIGGKRRWEHAQLCLSNPNVAEVAAERITSQLKARSKLRQVVSVSAQDWLGDCECEACQAAVRRTGTYSGLQLEFVNRVAELVEEVCPDITVTTLAYRQSKRPPTLDLRARDTVAIRFCTDFNASFNWPYHSFYDETIAPQRKMYEEWATISKRMRLWVYPHQYRHKLAPMPNLHAVVDNLGYFRDQGAESMFVEQSNGYEGWTPMRLWLWAKLAWNPDLDAGELIQDFIWGFYGNAAPAVAEYERLLVDHCRTYTDFAKRRNWIYAIHDEALYRHGFVEKARTILDRAAALAEDDTVRERVALLKVGVVYVDTVRLYMQMRDGDTPPDVSHYQAATDELQELCTRLDIRNVGFYDGSRTIGSADEWTAELRKVQQRRFDQRYLPTGAFRDACDGAILNESFEGVKTGGIPAAWERHVQQRDGQVFGIAEVSRHFVKGPTLHLRDQQSHVVIWTASDEALPAGKQWTVQFDFRLTGGLVYKASDVGRYKATGAGAMFGLKRGEPAKESDFLPLVQLNNDENAGEPVALVGLGEVLTADLAPDRWHRLVIRRDGMTWHFYLDDELKKTVADRDTDLRGYAFGSFRNWPHVAQDIHYADFKVGDFIKPRE